MAMAQDINAALRAKLGREPTMQEKLAAQSSAATQAFQQAGAQQGSPFAGMSMPSMSSARGPAYTGASGRGPAYTGASKFTQMQAEGIKAFQAAGQRDLSPVQGQAESNLAHGARMAGRSIASAAESAFNDPSWSQGVIDTFVNNPLNALWGGARQMTDPVVNGITQAFRYAADTPQKQEQRRAAAQAAPKPAVQAATPQSGMDVAAQALGGGAQQPMDFGAQLEQMVMGAMPGTTVTSRGRTPERNAKVGGTANSYHLTTRGAQARDFVPPKGVTMAAFASQMQSQLGGAFQVINEKDHVHIEPSGAGGGTQMAGGMPQIPGGAFDASGYQQALGMTQQAGALAMKPFSATYDPGQAPEAPKMVMPDKTDFSAQDAALALLKPAEVEARQQEKDQRNGIMAGIGQALASMNGTEGLGATLAKLGGAMLKGKAAGNEQFEQRLEAFDEKMAKYHVASLQQEGQKAQVIAAEARYEADLINKEASDAHEQAFKIWASRAQPTFSGGRMISQTVGKDGRVTVNSVAMDAGPMVDAYLKGATIMTQAAGDANQFALTRYKIGSAMFMQQAAAQAAQGAPDQGPSLLASMSLRVGEAIDSGAVAGMMPPEMMAGLQKQAADYANSMIPQTAMGSASEVQRSQLQRRFIVQQLTEVTARDPKFAEMLFSATGNVSNAIAEGERWQSRRVTQTQGRRGTTTSTTFDGE